MSDASVYLSFVRNRADMNYVVETSTNLSEWTEEGVILEELIENAAMTASVSLSENEKRFLRLRVVKTQ